MRKMIATLLLVGLVGAAIPGSTLAAKPGNNCGAASSGWSRVDGEGWWDRTVAGILEEGLTVAEAAELFGFASVDEFKDWVITGVMGDVKGIDKNGNGYICIKDLPNTPGLPGYIFDAKDDNSSSP